MHSEAQLPVVHMRSSFMYSRLYHYSHPRVDPKSDRGVLSRNWRYTQVIVHEVQYDRPSLSRPACFLNPMPAAIQGLIKIGTNRIIF